MIFEVDPTLPNPDDLKQDQEVLATARQEYAASKSGPLSILPNSLCYASFSQVIPEAVLSPIADEAANLTDYDLEERDIRHSRFGISPKLGQIEYIFDLGNWSPFFKSDPIDNKKYGTCLQILQYPYSKGSIHIRTASVTDPPIIDPKYYQGAHGALDVEVMTQCAKFADRISKTSPLAGIIRSRVFPPPTTGTVEAEDSIYREWIINTTITDWHPVGTCSLGGRKGIDGGVVDDRLRVYGVQGLRVIDASIMPLQISGHLQATIYAIAEKGAAMILEDMKA
jgi:hypothetical protein